MLIGYLLTRAEDDLPGPLQALAEAGCTEIVADGAVVFRRRLQR